MISRLYWFLILGTVSLHGVTIAALDHERRENTALHHALADSTIKRRALIEKADYLERRVTATEYLLRATRDKLALRDAQHDHEVIGIALRAAETYGLDWYEAGQLASTEQ